MKYAEPTLCLLHVHCHYYKLILIIELLEFISYKFSQMRKQIQED
jgi:hypothetical protein